MLPSVSKMTMIFSFGTSSSRVQKTRCMREDTSKPNWSFLTTIPTTLQQWHSKPKCGIQIFTPTEKCAFRSFTLQVLTPWTPRKPRKKDGDQSLELRQFWSVWFQWWTTPTSSLQLISMRPCSLEMTMRPTRKQLGSSLLDHLRTYDELASCDANIYKR